MSDDEDDILSRPVPDENLSAEVSDYLRRLKLLAESQQRQLEIIGQKSERLEQKLKNVQAPML